MPRRIRRTKKKLFLQNIELGMSPKNAAVVAKFSELERQKVQETVGFSLPDVAEQVGATPKVLMRSLAEKAGIVPGIEGATKTISAVVLEKDAGPQTKDFIDVPDENVRVDCLKSLLKVHTDHVANKEIDSEAPRAILISISVRAPQPVEVYSNASD